MSGWPLLAIPVLILAMISFLAKPAACDHDHAPPACAECER